MTRRDFAHAIPHKLFLKLRAGHFDSGKDIAALRRFIWMSQPKFAKALGISVHTLRGWEQDRRRPDGPALALLTLIARHPRLARESLQRAA